MKIKIGDKLISIKTADTDSRRRIGLKNVVNMPKDAGLLLAFDEEVSVPITMDGMKFPIDILFISDNKVVDFRPGKLGGKDIKAKSPFTSVLEVNSGALGSVKKGTAAHIVGEKLEGESYDLKDGGSVLDGNMHVLDEKGNIQHSIKGGERIVSRIETKLLHDLCIKSSNGTDKKAVRNIGRAIVRIINKQDERE